VDGLVDERSLKVVARKARGVHGDFERSAANVVRRWTGRRGNLLMSSPISATMTAAATGSTPGICWSLVAASCGSPW